MMERKIKQKECWSDDDNDDDDATRNSLVGRVGRNTYSENTCGVKIHNIYLDQVSLSKRLMSLAERQAQESDDDRKTFLYP